MAGVMQKNKEIMRRLGDGSVKLLATPFRKWEWHRPTLQIPTVQWHPDTGMTRYDWSRSHTPPEQLQFWADFRAEFISRSPMQPPPDDIFSDLEAKAKELKCGLENFEREVNERLAKYMFYKRSPCGQWSFNIMAESKGDAVFDIISVAATDYMTLPDWRMLTRARSWLFDDMRAVFILLPDQPPGKFSVYSNDRQNSLWLFSEQTRVVLPS